MTIRTTAALGLALALLPAPLWAQGRGGDLAPALGAKIPKVEARTKDGKKTIKLAEPKRLTVLVFGSHT